MKVTVDPLDILPEDKIYHVYPSFDGREHVTNRGAGCWCEPEIRFETVEHEPNDHEIIGAIIIHHIRQ